MGKDLGIFIPHRRRGEPSDVLDKRGKIIVTDLADLGFNAVEPA